MRRVISVFYCALAGLTGTIQGQAAPPLPPGPPPAFRILSDITLPPALERTLDVRWASDKSVYLAMGSRGTVEVSLDPAGPPPKEMIPAETKPGGFWISYQLAASPKYLVAAGPALVITWRRIEDSTRVEVPFAAIEAIDLRENRLAIVGAQRDEKGTFGAEGAIAWTGTVERKLEDARPLLYDVRGPGVLTLSRCSDTSLSQVRFLPDGSLVVLPGVQPGMNLYDPSGKLVRTWDTSALGIDTDCGALTEKQGAYLRMNILARLNWINQRRTVDTLLPFSQGPGLVVRTVEKGRTRWKLELVRLDGSVQTMNIPLEGGNEYFHLEGDVRAGKIVFLLAEWMAEGRGIIHPSPPRLIVADLTLGSAN